MPPEDSNQQYLWFFIILFLFLFAGVVLIFNKDRPLGTFATVKENKKSFSKVYTVFYISGVFSPTNLQLNVGDTARFQNDGFFPIRVISDPHPEHTDLAGFDSVSEIPPNGVFSYTFTKRGIYGYHNEKKPEQTGTIIVK